MVNAIKQFRENIRLIHELDTLYMHLKNNLRLPNDLSDILRAEWVYAVSALDKLVHELVRGGMIGAFQGTRLKTNRYKNFQISLGAHTNIITSAPTSIPPAEYWFEQEIIQKHKLLSFQDPEKIADILGFIWDEPHKLQALATSMGMSGPSLTTQLKTIISRRNQIVHEADIDVIAGTKNLIDKKDIDIVINFISLLGETINSAVV